MKKVTCYKMKNANKHFIALSLFFEQVSANSQQICNIDLEVQSRLTISVLKKLPLLFAIVNIKYGRNGM